VGIKLLLDYLHSAGYVHFQIPKVISLGLVLIIFVIAFIWAKIEGPKEPEPMMERAEDLLAVEDAAIDAVDGNVQK
jgi:hypothetical protein